MWRIKRRARRGKKYTWGAWVEMGRPYWVTPEWWLSVRRSLANAHHWLDVYGFHDTAQREYRVVEEANHADK